MNIDQWLIRTSKNQISGPYSKAEVCGLIEKGAIGVHDEVCQANNYWFYLNEDDEVHRQLGIRVPQAARAAGAREDETLTETMTETDSVRTTVPRADHKNDEDLEPYMPELSEVTEENTAVLSNRALRQFRSSGGGGGAAASAASTGASSSPSETGSSGPVPIPIVARRELFKPQTQGRGERGSLLRWFLLLLFLIVTGGIGAVFWLLHRGH